MGSSRRIESRSSRKCTEREFQNWMRDLNLKTLCFTEVIQIIEFKKLLNEDKTKQKEIRLFCLQFGGDGDKKWIRSLSSKWNSYFNCNFQLSWQRRRTSSCLRFAETSVFLMNSQ